MVVPDGNNGVCGLIQGQDSWQPIRAPRTTEKGVISSDERLELRTVEGPNTTQADACDSHAVSVSGSEERAEVRTTLGTQIAGIDVTDTGPSEVQQIMAIAGLTD